MRIVEIKRVGQSACILLLHVKEGVKQGKSTIFFHFRKRQELGHEKSGKNRRPTKNTLLNRYKLKFRFIIRLG